MPRRPRVFVEGLVHHVHTRPGRGEAPFQLEDEAGRFWLFPLLAYPAPSIGCAIPSLSTIPDLAPIPRSGEECGRL